ncbi:IMP dehydrogenase [Vitreoscilla filiformis]|uniref:IMP dehydrogenase n=1 Tax=Vitreoscilla filiformis TaxID=63 RepID=A0A221KAX8_VITFI|nr:transglutaminase family protein [Vitreoscilla filiformis]ASM75997.1 IMP dehydrogenase [Vitreoscilla filiformis]
MSIHVALKHVTHYKYDRPVSLSPQVVRLRPAPHCRTPILSYSLNVEPKSHFINWQQDPFANYLARLVFPEKTTEFKVTIDLVAEMSVYNPFDFFLEPSAQKIPFAYDEALAAELAPYLVTEAPTPEFAKFLATIDRTPTTTIDFLVAINQRLQQEISYLIRLEPGVQTPEETLTKRSGSCRDSGWLLVNTLRHLGLAARFASGYLIQLTPDVKALDGPSGTEVDFTDLHAWCEVYLPGAGWIGLDPTSGLLAGEGHIPLACTPQPSSAAPISGAVDKCEVTFGHEMAVTRVWESPRVTKPYSEEQWADVLKLGEQVDAELVAGDVRLTMGGEPTFVSVDDRDGAEWNTDALGPTKRLFATDLVHRLRNEYGQGGFLHFGQGKWYPGEQLPRWALSIYWRADGQPCWHDPSLFADEREPHHYTSADAKRFISTLSGKLGVTDKHVQTGYEDTWYYLWRERRLPVNVDPFDAKLDDEMERIRLRRVFDQGLEHEVGYVLPIKRAEGPTLAGPRWVTGPWFFRDERMYLIPGDSPMGLRLPLDSLPWVKKQDYPYLHEHDPFAPRDTLPTAARLKAQYQGQDVADATEAGYASHRAGGGFAEGGVVGVQGADLEGLDALGADGWPLAGDGSQAGGLGEDGLGLNGTQGDDTGLDSATGPGRAAALRLASSASTAFNPDAAPARNESAHWITRTALCVEVRDPRRANGPKAEAVGSPSGVLYVFMPPMQRLEHYLELVAAVEATAAELGMKIVMEGYPPPRDPRLKLLQVTPDPGVIEVNIHPAHNWKELVEHTEFLYDAAWLSRLSTEKFMVDGRHTGTGGGNHFVLGGATPADSPFLRRPDLLASLLTYWHNHPSLSYLFSGMFIGPTSQAPRVDEARNDQLRELEIALGEIERNKSVYGGHMPPWLVDRTLRNVLVDVTGNTHRSEFCIDKLYSPDSSTGRLGLLELRAFEMPPHARMSIVQQLLLRSLIARFWNEPYRAPLVRWGTELHDRFLLPHFVQEDFADVMEEMRSSGYGFDAAWFAPHFEFRFPKIGEYSNRGIHMTLRNALEPWHVMGEEGSAGGTVRYVDSSLERVEVKVSGLIDPRHRITVNGVTVPLQPTGRVGEYVAGVRFRAWQPSSALHPTIGVHAPLTVDIVDTWMKRSLGGCQYHVAHPGGRNYVTFPVNAYEAESRRLARFFPMGHSVTPVEAGEPQRSLEFPFTLDLRRIGR